jgi:hypothetical protein
MVALPLSILSGGLALLIVAVGVSSLRKQPKVEDIIDAGNHEGPEPESPPPA